MNYFYQQAQGRAQTCLTILQILGNSTEGNAINQIRQIPILFVAKEWNKTSPRSVSGHA